uniref:Uncharacterized protein n=1 Tax=Arundo donax TaxID=35708 RepID=A0A0A9CKQ9_ARUDO
MFGSKSELLCLSTAGAYIARCKAHWSFRTVILLFSYVRRTVKESQSVFVSYHLVNVMRSRYINQKHSRSSCLVN